MGAAMMPSDIDARLTTSHDLGTSTNEGNQGRDHDMLMLCGVMLVAVGVIGLITWLLHRARRKWRMVRDGKPASEHTTSAPRPRSRGHSPPPSLAYSVIRC
jgi:hypothetical protein